MDWGCLRAFEVLANALLGKLNDSEKLVSGRGDPIVALRGVDRALDE